MTNGLSACKVVAIGSLFLVLLARKRSLGELLFESPPNAKSNADEVLMDLALKNKEKAKAQHKKEMKWCDCRPIDPPEDAQRCSVEYDLRKDFDFRNNWHHFVSLFLSS